MRSIYVFRALSKFVMVPILFAKRGEGGGKIEKFIEKFLDNAPTPTKMRKSEIAKVMFQIWSLRIE
jgi:hypothetical protein